MEVNLLIDLQKKKSQLSISLSQSLFLSLSPLSISLFLIQFLYFSPCLFSSSPVSPLSLFLYLRSFTQSYISYVVKIVFHNNESKQCTMLEFKRFYSSSHYFSKRISHNDIDTVQKLNSSHTQCLSQVTTQRTETTIFLVYNWCLAGVLRR